jgi:hypothetical protein
LRGGRLLVSERAVPGEDCVRLGNGGNLSQGLLAQLGAKLSEFLTLVIGQLHTTVDLVAQDTILGHEIVIAKPECIVDRL